MYKANVRGVVIRARTRDELLRKMRRHLWKHHRTWMINRIKAGQAQAKAENPSVQDLISAVRKGSTRAGLEISRLMSERRYQEVKRVMDAVSPMLPQKALVAWEAIEAIHDLKEKAKRR